jgi:hypothetical protein
MNTPRTFRTLLGIAGLSGAALFAAGMLALAQPDTPAQANDHGYGHGRTMGYGFHGHHRYGHGGPCSDRAAGMLKRLDGVVPDLMDLSPSQQKSWEDLMASADAARAKVKEACGDPRRTVATAPERLARVETIMTAALDGVHEVRPKLDAFYAGLSERQRKGLDELLDRRGHHDGRMDKGPGGLPDTAIQDESETR